MTYGLYDADLNYYLAPFYNLELMKLSSYYKHKREIVGLSPDFSPNRYSHFIIRQDFYNSNPLNLTYKNIEYGGRAFDGEKYKALPLDIESMKPDIQLYANVPLPIKKKYKKYIGTMQNAEHLRLSLDGATIWKDFEKQFHHNTRIYGVIFHDYDLGKIDGVIDFLEQELPNFVSKGGYYIGMKFPVQVNDKENFFKWLNIPHMGNYYSLQYNNILQNEEILRLASNKISFRFTNQITINITNELSNTDSIGKTIQNVLRSIINLRSYQIFFPLKYDESVINDNNWKKVMKLISLYNKHLFSLLSHTENYKRTEPYETIYSYCKNVLTKAASLIKEDFFSKENIQSIFQFVRENDYDLFKDFYEYRGGEIRNDR